MAGEISGTAGARRTLAPASVAHALHDGYVDMIYVLLPAWQAEFSLDYLALAIVRRLCWDVSRTPGSIRAPREAPQCAKRRCSRNIAECNRLRHGRSLSGGLIALSASLALAGAGGSTQHTLASAAVSRAYGERAAVHSAHILRRRLGEGDASASHLFIADHDAILSLLILPLRPGMLLLPFLGIMLNGTSSVLYGTIPELVSPRRMERAFAIFYTGILGSSALAPVLYGGLGDSTGVTWAVVAAAITALAVVPLMLNLAPRLQTDGR